MAKSSGKKGGKKSGRNKDWCKNYKLKNQRERNKARRLAKHMKRFPGDEFAKAKLEFLMTEYKIVNLAA